MEERLQSEYKDLGKQGLKVKGWWFRLRARQILGELQSFATLMLGFLASSRGIAWAWGAQQTHVRRSQQISTVSSSIFIAVSEELLKKVTRLGLWDSGHHIPLQTWTTYHCHSHSVMAQHMLILANALSGCVEVLLGLKNVSAQPSLPFLLMVNQEWNLYSSSGEWVNKLPWQRKCIMTGEWALYFNQRPGVMKGSCTTGCKHVGSQLAKVPASHPRCA